MLIEQVGSMMAVTGVFLISDQPTETKRIYPHKEVSKAVEKMLVSLGQGNTILGEADHPENIEINLDRVSHVIKNIWNENNEWYVKVHILPTPMGKLCQSLFESGLELKLSPRGTGIVDEHGVVSDYEIITIDILSKNPKQRTNLFG